MPQIAIKIIPFDKTKHATPSSKRRSNTQMDELAKALRAHTKPDQFEVIEVPEATGPLKVTNAIRTGLASRGLRVAIHNFSEYLEVVLKKDEKAGA